MQRRTKILATLGPATDTPEALEQLLRAGTNLVRVNFSHGDRTQHTQRIQNARALSQSLHIPLGILADLQGPKIRIGQFQEGSILLREGDTFTLDANCPLSEGTQETVGLTYPHILKDLKPQDRLLLDDGLMELVVTSCAPQKAICRVAVGGKLLNNKGINRKGGGLTADALTPKDWDDLETAIAENVDFVALSFVKTAQDILDVREKLKQAGSHIHLIAKIERAEALTCLQEIIDAADGVMVARGDLGVEIGDAELPAIQKEIIRLARASNKPVITATQMMESMIQSPLPTRAEVFDVANAVLDGTDAVMLSAETATGAHPYKVVEAMHRVCLGAEAQPASKKSHHRLDAHFQQVDEAIAMAAMYTANHLDIKAIIALTESGYTPLWMSRIRSDIPIYGYGHHDYTLRRMSLYRGVNPFLFELANLEETQINQKAIEALKAEQLVKTGDWVIVTRGDSLGVQGKTNAMKIMEVA